MTERPVAGKAIVIVLGAVILAALLLFVAYKAREAQAPTQTMRFERGMPPANATVFVLDYKPVHAAYFLEDHLGTALDRGNSTETVQLRVQSMHDTLRRLTAASGPEWWLSWDGATVHVTLA